MPRFSVIVLEELFSDFEAHLAGSAAEGTESGFFVAGVHVFHLHFDDVHDLLLGDFPDLGLVRFFGSRGDAGGFFEKDRGGWGFGDESEALVFVNSNDNGEDIARLLLGCRVEFFAERHDVHTLLSQSGTDGWGRVCGAGGNLQFDLSYDFFSHMKNVPQFFAEKGHRESRPGPG